MKQNLTRKKQDINQELIGKGKWCQLKSKVVLETEQIIFWWKIMTKHLFLRMTCTIESLTMSRKMNWLWVQIKMNRVQLWVRRKYGGHMQMFSKGHKKLVLQSQGRTIVDVACEICTKLTQIRERVINVREASIKSLIWSLKVNTAVLHNELRLSYTTTLLQPNPYTRSQGFCRFYEGTFKAFSFNDQLKKI